MDKALHDLDHLYSVDVKPSPTPLVYGWFDALSLSATRRFDLKPASYQINARMLARLYRSSCRTVLETLSKEYPLGWLTDNQDNPVCLDSALPQLVQLY